MKSKANGSINLPKIRIIRYISLAMEFALKVFSIGYQRNPGKIFEYPVNTFHRIEI